MTFERDQERTRRHSTEALRDLPDPGRSSASAALLGREQPVTSGILMRKARDTNGVAADAETAVAAASSSSGTGLPAMLQRKFEASLGVDLSGVRVHTGESSAAANAAVGAKAYTVGQDIHFGAGQYDPSSTSGQHLLAHEVAHTVQQRGGAAVRQHKLEVSSPGDALEHEADRAADAMITGAPTSVSGATGLSRKVFREVAGSSYGALQGAGDEAEANAMNAPLRIDTVSVQTDRSRVGEIIGDIDKHEPVIKEAEKESSAVQGYSPLVTNTATRTNLSIFDDKLDVSSVDTKAFAVQYRAAFADYQRLLAEATEYLSVIGADSNDPLGTIGDGFANTKGLKNGPAQAGLDRFRSARKDLNTAATKMNSQLTKCRGAANLLQGALYKARAAAAAANGENAAKKLASVRAEIAAVAGGVGKVIKICSAVSGLAGGGGAIGALATPATSGGSVDIDPSQSGLAKGGTVFLNDHTKPSNPAALPVGQAIASDLWNLAGGPGPDGMAEALVTAIGEYANRDKISNLQQSIAQAAAEEASFSAAAETQSMVGFQEQMEGAAGELSVLLAAFTSAKKEMAEAGQVLMEELNKAGPTGKNQARGVLFVTDADRFLAQAENAISVGKNQQANLKNAADDRKALRGTTAVLEGGKDAAAQYYYRCHKTSVPGMLWGTNNTYRLEKVFVTFQDSGGFGVNDINQGGAGSVEGTGSAHDEVANKLETLESARTQVKELQAKVQGSLGLGGPGLSP